jgi:hypothetical protein
MTELIQITSGVWSWGKFTDAKKGGILGHAPPENFENPVAQIG